MANRQLGNFPTSSDPVYNNLIKSHIFVCYQLEYYFLKHI